MCISENFIKFDVDACIILDIKKILMDSATEEKTFLREMI